MTESSRTSRSPRGLTLLEVLVALVLLSVIVAAVVPIAARLAVAQGRTPDTKPTAPLWLVDAADGPLFTERLTGQLRAGKDVVVPADAERGLEAEIRIAVADDSLGTEPSKSRRLVIVSSGEHALFRLLPPDELDPNSVSLGRGEGSP